LQPSDGGKKKLEGEGVDWEEVNKWWVKTRVCNVLFTKREKIAKNFCGNPFSSLKTRKGCPKFLGYLR